MEPLVPADVELLDFAFMPVDVRRVLTSETWVLGSGDERAAAMTLWLASWHEKPAGSLPDNDRMLEHLSQAKNWRKVRAHAMRGWQLASDGRYYHRMVAEKVLEAWLEKLAQRLSSGAGNAKRWGVEFDPQPIEEQMKASRGMLALLNPQSRALSKKRTSGVSSASKKHPDGNAGGEPSGIPPGIPSGSQETGTGTGTGTGKQEPQGSLRSPSSPAAPPTQPPPGGKGGQAAQTKAERLAAVTADAMAAYNAIMARPNGELSVATDVGIETKRANVKRCIRTAKQICERQHAAGEYPTDLITPKFWNDYFTQCDKDDFKAGRQAPGRGHGNWKPDFEYLTRAEVMAEVFDQAATEAAA